MADQSDQHFDATSDVNQQRFRHGAAVMAEKWRRISVTT